MGLSHDDLRALAAKATPGPWRQGKSTARCKLPHFPHGKGECRYTFDGWLDNAHAISRSVDYDADDVPENDLVAGTWDYEEGGIIRKEDAAFIAAANPTRLTALLDDLRDAQRENERLRASGEQLARALAEIRSRASDTFATAWGANEALRIIASKADTAFIFSPTPDPAPFEGKPVGELTPITLGVEQAPTFTFAEIAAAEDRTDPARRATAGDDREGMPPDACAKQGHGVTKCLRCGQEWVR